MSDLSSIEGKLVIKYHRTNKVVTHITATPITTRATALGNSGVSHVEGERWQLVLPPHQDSARSVTLRSSPCSRHCTYPSVAREREVARQCSQSRRRRSPSQ